MESINTRDLPPVLRGWVQDASIRDLSRKTIYLYVTVARQVLAHAGVDDIDALTTAHLRDFFYERRTQVQPSTLSIESRSLAAMLNWAVKDGAIATSPMRSVDIPKPSRKRQDILLRDDLERLVGAAKGDGLDGIRNEAIVLTLIESGARVGELVSMTVSGLDLGEATATVSGKSGERMIVFGNRAARAIAKWLRVRGRYQSAKASGDALWIGKAGPTTVSGVAQVLADASKRAGLGRVNPHRLRHSWAHAALDSGTPDRVVQLLGGWAGPQMLHHYAADLAQSRAIAAYTSPLDKRRGGS